ncbi:MAG: D-beta-D-heptose 7-phosphate kinase / D-beta-D-heptose 1-phosphate adenosyltransferase [Thermoleophilaceae bacterium]|nr:D-beta-D-heptose 7-phosphate kinase / D-beta-D-heptose 1-phosphate adenosyltransferase [Thermoleophilaceae bacterium]
MSAALVVVGDALLDRDVIGTVERLAPDAPVPVLDELEQRVRPGGAALAAALAARDGRAVTLITALADDEAGRTLRGAIEGSGVELVALELRGTTPEKIRFTHQGRSLIRVDRGGGRLARPAPVAARAAIRWAPAVLVSDYGRGVAAEPELRGAISTPLRSRLVAWDPHPRGPEPAPGTTIVTPNESELSQQVPVPDGRGAEAALARARVLRERWGVRAVCVTRGVSGALLLDGDDPPLSVSAPQVDGGDPCGAGDRFASRLAGVLADGGATADAVTEAVAAASDFVGAGGAGAVGSATRPSRRGGLVVATGGCFDLLHSGHVRTLEAARRLGDHLVVCLNSDASVRRLKGPGRPLVSERDRAAVLSALSCVDAVRIFDGDTPVEVLDEIRPDIWAKGGDYSEAELPEERVVTRWGGRVVILPYVEGRSTTRLIEEAANRV